MLKEFDDIIEITLHHEGGYVHDPNDLPLPGPPAKKIALKIPGSRAPSFNIFSSKNGFVKNSVSLFIYTSIVLLYQPNKNLSCSGFLLTKS